jgi:hypothetical protein
MAANIAGNPRVSNHGFTTERPRDAASSRVRPLPSQFSLEASFGGHTCGKAREAARRRFQVRTRRRDAGPTSHGGIGPWPAAEATATHSMRSGGEGRPGTRESFRGGTKHRA